MNQLAARKVNFFDITRLTNRIEPNVFSNFIINFYSSHPQHIFHYYYPIVLQLTLNTDISSTIHLFKHELLTWSGWYHFALTRHCKKAVLAYKEKCSDHLTWIEWRSSGFTLARNSHSDTSLVDQNWPGWLVISTIGFTPMRVDFGTSDSWTSTLKAALPTHKLFLMVFYRILHFFMVSE